MLEAAENVAGQGREVRTMVVARVTAITGEMWTSLTELGDTKTFCLICRQLLEESLFHCGDELCVSCKRVSSKYPVGGVNGWVKKI